ncbi:MAG: DUF1476 domain-containing protein [Rhodomicrobiaceae bacterium]
MNNLNDREKAFEAKFAHDEELRFKVDARRDKLLGLWLAEKMGKTGDEAESYAKEVVIADLKEAGDADVIEKVMADIKEANLSITEDEIVKKLSEFFVTAGEELAS